MPALICGSLAFDTITTFPGRFAEQILPEQVHILNVSFLVPTPVSYTHLTLPTKRIV